MSNDIKFTFVLPVHNGMPNGHNYIQAQIESILNQDYKNFNLIILENCSDDGTAEYLKTLNDDRIEIQYSDTLLSIDDNWRRIINVKRSEYMIMAMADDLYKPNYLTEMVKLITKYPNAVVFRTNIELINENSTKIGYSNINEIINFEDYLKGRLTHTYFETLQGYCFRTDFYNEVGGCPCIFKGFYMDDKLVLMGILKHFMPVSQIPACSYRIHKASCSGTPDFENDIKGYNYIFKWIKSLNNKKFNKIVKTYLPYHIKTFSKFFTKEQIPEYKKIYPIFRINENDLYHKFISWKLKYIPANKKILQTFLLLLYIKYN